MLYSMGLLVAAFLIGMTVLVAIGINWVRSRIEARRQR